MAATTKRSAKSKTTSPRAPRESSRAIDEAGSFIACAGCGADALVSTKGKEGRKVDAGSNVFNLTKKNKYRRDWMNMVPCDAISLLRYFSPRHWFLAPLIASRQAVLHDGFSLAKPAIEWNQIDGNPWRKRVDFDRIFSDSFWEMVIASNLIVVWKHEPENVGEISFEVKDSEHHRYEYDTNKKMNYITMPGITATNRVKNARKLYSDGTDQDNKPTGLRFAVWQPCKTSYGTQYPELAVMMDDIELLEMFRVGDWNGAYKRREMIRHSKLGYGVTAGQHAATPRTHATKKRAENATKLVSAVDGAADIATNFDHSIDWNVFPSDFFNQDATEKIRQRLVFHGGFYAQMLLSTKGQIEANGGFLLQQLRDWTLHTRDELRKFLCPILNSPSFLGSLTADAPVIDVLWSMRSLYSVEDAINRVTKLTAAGIMSPQTSRGEYGLDNEREAKLLKEAHEDRHGYTPAFERAQGMVMPQFPEDFPGSDNPAPSGGTESPEGGRPT
jgi:hypothetical protein